MDKEGGPKLVHIGKPKPEAKVFVEPAVDRFANNRGHHGVNVVVELKGETVWQREIKSYVPVVRDFLYLQKPFYAKRIERAARKAEKIAASVNNANIKPNNQNS
jgi:hypothetical protein